VGFFSFYWLPSTPAECRWLTESEKRAAHSRSLRDGSSEVDVKFDFKEAMSAFRGWKMGMYAIISFTYSMGFTTTATFLPQIVQRLGFNAVKTNLWTVAPNCVGVVALLCVTKSSDIFKERTFHLAFAMSITLAGLIILAAVDVLENKGVGYFAMFLLTSGAVGNSNFPPELQNMLTSCSIYLHALSTRGTTTTQRAKINALL